MPKQLIKTKKDERVTPVSSKDEWGMPKSNLGKKCLELAQSSHCRYCDGWNNDTRLKCRGDIKQEALDIFELLTQSRKEAYEQGVLDTEAELRKKSQGDRDEELWSEGIKEGKRQAKYETRPSSSVGPSSSVAPSSSKTENKWVEKLISQTEIRVRGEVVEEVRKNVTHWWSEYMALRNQSLEGDAYETEDTGLSFSDLCAKRLSKLKQP